MPRTTVAPVALEDLPVRPSVRIRRFFAERLRHGKGEFAGRPFVLEPWQFDELVVPVFDDLVPAERGRILIRRVTEFLEGVPKKNGKTHLAAGLGAYGLVGDGHYERDPNGWLWQPEYGAEVYNVAGSKDQARILFGIGSGFVERDPYLRAVCRVYKDAIEVPETDSVWRVLASDARLTHGPNPSMAIIDEIWNHRDPELYESFASAGDARLQPLVGTITTAGWDQESIAFKLYRRGLGGKDPRFHFRWFQAPDGCALDDRKAWRLANPSRWVTNAKLAAQLKRARELGLESQFRRWRLNQWTSGKEAAIPLELWDANGGRPRIPEGADVVVGVDSAPKRDTTAIVVDHRADNGVHHVRSTVMRADPDTGYLDFEALEDVLRELARMYHVGQVLVDPFNMIRSMVMLREEGLPIEEFPQSDVRMVPASMALYELLVNRRLRHGGDRELRRCVQAAAKRVTERGWRLHKRTSAGVIDALVALAMAVYALERGDEEEEELQPSLFVPS